MKYIPDSVTRTVARQALKAQKHSPQILFGAGIVGIVSTVVMASRATLRLEGVLEDMEKDKADAGLLRDLKRSDYQDQDYQKDITHIYVRSTLAIVKLYGPSVVVGVASIACLAKSHDIQSKRYTALAAAYTTLERGFSEYRERVQAQVGEEKESELYYGVEKLEYTDPTTGAKVKGKHMTAGTAGYSRIFDQVNSKRWSKTPEHNMFFIKCQEQYANDQLKSRGFLFLNEVYEALGFDPVPEGQIVGWLWDSERGDGYVDFGVFSGDFVQAKRFVMGDERSVFLDFNVDGPIWEKI